MAVTRHDSGSITIRGIKYTVTSTDGQLFTCYEKHNGNAKSEGDGNSAAELIAGQPYWFSAWATDDDNGGALTAYPYLVSSMNGGELGWYKENVFPYATYTITYNANGGSGAPSSQTKTYGTALTLSSTKPTRTGYTFKGWGTSADDTSVNYSPGQSYTANSNATLYAIWQENTLTINYYSNYATSAFADALNAVGSDKNVKVWEYVVYYDNDYSEYGLANYSTSNGSVYMTRTGYTATGNWGTSTGGGTLVNENTGFSSGQAVAEAFGKSIKTGNATINVYAQWKENTLTANYYSNYATSAWDGAVNEVGADKNVIVRTYSWTYSSDALDSGLHNYSTDGDTTYLARKRYKPTGYWGTELEGGILVNEDTGFASGQKLAEAFGLSLKTSSQIINLYAQWELASSIVTVYDANGNAHEGMVFIYDDEGVQHCAILTYYDQDGKAHEVV